MADLLDVERPEAEPAGLALHLHLEHLERVEQVQHRAVVDRQRVGRRVSPRVFPGAPFEEGETVGIEEPAAVRGRAHGLVGHAAVHRAKGREQPRPRVVTSFEHLLAVAIGGLAELVSQRGDPVVLAPRHGVREEPPLLLGGEQEHEPHHHGHGGFVEDLLGDPVEEPAVPIAVDAVDGLDEHLHRAPDLKPQLVGDLVLVAGALGEERLELSRASTPKKRCAEQERPKRPERERLFEPELRRTSSRSPWSARAARRRASSARRW